MQQLDNEVAIRCECQRHGTPAPFGSHLGADDGEDDFNSTNETREVDDNNEEENLEERDGEEAQQDQLSDSDHYQDEEEDDDAEWSMEGPTNLDVHREQTQQQKNWAYSFKNAKLEDFVSENQPDDATREQATLLILQPGRVWTVHDLQEESNLRLGLHLLYNQMQEKHKLHFTKSIQIRYSSFPKDVVALMKASAQPSAHQLQAAENPGKC